MSVKARIWIERQFVKIVVTKLLAAGNKLFIDRSEEGDSDREPILNASDASLDEIMACDDERLYVNDNAWIWFVYGNDGWDVITDYTVNLEDVLAPVNQLAMDENIEALIAASR